MAQQIFMSSGLRNHWFMLRLLLLINAVLICVIFFLLRDVKHQPKNSDCSESNIRSLGTDALNSISIKLM